MNAPTEFMDFEEAIPMPFSIEAESSVIGALLMDNGAWDRVGDMLVEGDFFRFEHRAIFTGIAQLVNSGKPADVVTVFEHLQSQGKADEAGGLAYINQLAQYIPSAANVRRYAEIVRERSLSRQLIAISNDVRDLAADATRPFEERVEQATASIAKLLEGGMGDDWQSSQDGAVELLDRIQSQADGTAPQNFTPTGLADLDNRLDGGLRDGELVVIGARPGMGKSALALTIADHVSIEQGLPVAVFSMEMPRAQIHARRLSMRTRIHLSRIRRPERLTDHDWPKITSAVELIRHSRLFVNDQSGLNHNQLRAKARGIRRKAGKLGLVVVDYLGLMVGTDPKQPRTYQLEDITKGLKSLAKELRCPILLLCQIGRGVEQRPDPMPMLSDLRDSGAIEQDADVVIFVHREIVTKPDLSDDWKYYAKLMVAKLRDGAPGPVHAMYVGENTLFQDWPESMELPSSRVRSGSAKPVKEL